MNKVMGRSGSKERSENERGVNKARQVGGCVSDLQPMQDKISD